MAHGGSEGDAEPVSLPIVFSEDDYKQGYTRMHIARESQERFHGTVDFAPSISGQHRWSPPAISPIEFERMLVFKVELTRESRLLKTTCISHDLQVIKQLGRFHSSWFALSQFVEPPRSISLVTPKLECCSVFSKCSLRPTHHVNRLVSTCIRLLNLHNQTGSSSDREL